MIVDGVQASCYASSDHDLAHIGMKPIQWFPEMVQWIFEEVDGFSPFIRTAKNLGEWILPNAQFL